VVDQSVAGGGVAPDFGLMNRSALLGDGAQRGRAEGERSVSMSMRV
jgi:hypothetical protein